MYWLACEDSSDCNGLSQVLVGAYRRYLLLIGTGVERPEPWQTFRLKPVPSKRGIRGRRSACGSRRCRGRGLTRGSSGHRRVRGCGGRRRGGGGSPASGG